MNVPEMEILGRHFVSGTNFLGRAHYKWVPNKNQHFNMFQVHKCAWYVIILFGFILV